MTLDLNDDEARVVVNALVRYIQNDRAAHGFEDLFTATSLFCRLMVHEEVRESIRDRLLHVSQPETGQRS